MNIKTLFNKIRNNLNTESGLNANMKSAFLKTLTSVEEWLGNSYANEEVIVIRDKDEFNSIKENIENMVESLSGGSDFYCEIIKVKKIDSSESKIYVYLLDLDELR